PFYDTYPKEIEIYNKENIVDKTLSHTLIVYLNSVRYTDYVIVNIIKKISEKTGRPTYFIITSDHSTSIEKNKNGHGTLG
ncbi:sulfatase-like hydrolase/transferase, partial [Aliarcobacter butzleri]|uniref:sulfatase-like hydrolase/transferase n=1 Tax=Aliarcobacter butzleri TaxID=28197 RepID=UPI003AF475DC